MSDEGANRQAPGGARGEERAARVAGDEGANRQAPGRARGEERAARVAGEEQRGRGPDRRTGTGGWRFEAASAPKRLLPSLRARSALASALVVAVALAGGAAAMFYLLQRSLIHTLKDDQRSQMSQVVDWVRADGSLEALKSQLERSTPQGQIVQVVEGVDVVAASETWSYQHPFSDLQPADGQWLAEKTGPLTMADSRRPFVVLTAGATHGNQLYTVIVVSDFMGQRESLIRVLHLLAIGLPLLVVMVGAISWYLVGRALRPVESIRSRVAGIGAERLEERVPVPQTRDEISHLAVTMNQMLDRLQAAQEAQRQFVSDASHELRSPLATLAASIDVARNDPGGKAWRDLSGLMSDEVERMSSLVGNLLLLARADDRGLRVEPHDVDLDDVLSAEVRLLRAAGTVPVVAAISPARVLGDELQLSQVARNLIDNATRHARTGIGIRLQQVGAVAVLIVEDDGPGIPQVDRLRVFERFVRLDFSRDRASGGSGLGLAIVAEVVQAHRGRVEIRDAPGGGCQVIVQLPAVSGADIAEAVDEGADEGADAESPQTSSSSR